MIGSVVWDVNNKRVTPTRRKKEIKLCYLTVAFRQQADAFCLWKTKNMHSAFRFTSISAIKFQASPATTFELINNPQYTCRRSSLITGRASAFWVVFPDIDPASHKWWSIGSRWAIEKKGDDQKEPYLYSGESWVNGEIWIFRWVWLKYIEPRKKY